MDGEILPDFVEVKTVPFKTDRHFILDLRKNPIISLLTYQLVFGQLIPGKEEEKKNCGLELEKAGLLPKGTTERLFCRLYKEARKKFPKSPKGREQKSRFKDIKPLSDEEIQELMQKAIREEYLKKL